MCDKIHAFEAAGLGKAPFWFVGIESAADREAVQTERASNGMVFTTNYSTSCDYCGKGIQNAFQIRSADGKSFKVGCDCIKKTGDSGLKKVIADCESNKRKEKAQQKRLAERARISAAKNAFLAGRCESLRSKAHPSISTLTLWDYVNFCMTTAGGTLKAATIVEKCLG